jgi:hypothetical protein
MGSPALLTNLTATDIESEPAERRLGAVHAASIATSETTTMPQFTTVLEEINSVTGLPAVSAAKVVCCPL